MTAVLQKVLKPWGTRVEGGNETPLGVLRTKVVCGFRDEAPGGVCIEHTYHKPGRRNLPPEGRATWIFGEATWIFGADPLQVLASSLTLIKGKIELPSVNDLMRVSNMVRVGLNSNVQGVCAYS